MMKIFIPLLLLGLTILASCSLLGSDDDTARPDIPGKIVMAASDNAGTSQIYTMNADGSNVRQLTDLGPEDDASQPSWSPDGRQIIFSSTKRGTSAGRALWVMDADGSNQHLLYDPEPDNLHVPPLAGSNARWSPDGSKVAFDFCRNCSFGTNSEIYLFDTTTKEVSRLTDNPASDRNPTWSPDGSQIAFSSDRDYGEVDTLRFRNDFYAMSSKGTNIKRITEFGFIGSLEWKNANEIFFNTYELSTNFKNVFTYDLNSGVQKLLVENLQVRQFWLFWNSMNKQLYILDKRHEELPVILSIADSNGNVIEKNKLNDPVLKSAVGFNLIFRK